MARLAVTEANRNVFRQCKAHETIVSLLHQHSQNTQFVCVGLQAVEALSHSTALKSFFAERVVPLVRDLLGAAQPYSITYDAPSVGVMLGALDRLSRDHDGGAKAVVDANTLNSVFLAMHQYPRDKPVQLSGCSIVKTLAKMMSPANEELCTQAVPPLLSVFICCAQAPDVLCVAAEAMWWLSVESTANRERMIDQGLHQYLCEAMQRFPTEIVLLSNCCAALWEFAEATNNCPVLQRAGVLELVHRSATVNEVCRSHIQLQYNAYGAMQALIRGSGGTAERVSTAQIDKWLAECAQRLHLRPDEAHTLRSTEDVQHFFARRVLVFDLGRTRRGAHGCILS
jgi:hypothetical protein